MSFKYLLALLAATVCMSGCSNLGALLMPEDGMFIPAQFKLPPGKTAIIVDDSLVQFEDPTAKSRIVETAVERLESQRAIRKSEVVLISHKKVAALKTETPAGDWIPIRKLGKKLGADTVIYANITRFDLTGDTESPLVFLMAAARVKVLNINELANFLKPVVLPGEKLEIKIVKEGKEHNQGVGYLDDGTMVVLENGRSMLGQTLTVVISTVIQTQAGKMIFTKLEKQK